MHNFSIGGKFRRCTGPDAPADYRLFTGNAEDLPPPFSETMAGQPPCAGGCDAGCCQSCCCPRWTAAADFIILDRIGGTNQVLVSRVPGSVWPHDLPSHPGTEALNGNDFQQGLCGGPQVDLIRHGDCGYDLELSYFQIDGWNSDRSVGPYVPFEWLTMRCPGNFLQTNQKLDQAMAWAYASELYNAEFNVRWNPSSRVTVLAGFRWVNLFENLVGALEPPTMPEPPFWTTSTTNNLYGLQIGADGKILERGRFSIEGLLKAGLFDDHAEQTTFVSVIHKQVRSATDSIDRTAFIGETGLQCKYQLAKGLSLKAGYEAIWLEGVALAPGQVQETYCITKPKTVEALGVNCGSGVFYHGATVGLEYSF